MRLFSSYRQLGVVLIIAFTLFMVSCNGKSDVPNNIKVTLTENKQEIEERDSIQVINGTFLGNDQRNYYGDSIGNDLTELWKLNLGEGTTNLADGQVVWKGAGWTGQPLIVRELDERYLLQGCYDHRLKKINAATGEVVWSYEYDDVLKGTGSIWHNKNAKTPEEKLVVLQGSRLGIQNSLATESIYSYRAISYFSGEELWRMNSKRSESYSRDVDASAVTINDTAYIGLENGYFVSFDPSAKRSRASKTVEFNEPDVFQEIPLFEKEDSWKHGGNLVTEASPARIKNHLYLASGSGHVYGYNLNTKAIDWQFDIGSDLDGSPVVTSDGCILITVEKQYISGRGGVFKLDPSKEPENCVVWYFPTGDRSFADWKGGIIGSVAINDSYNKEGEYPGIAVFTGIDGTMYLVNHKKVEAQKTCLGPNEEKSYPMPVLLDKRTIGPSISTPIFVNNKIVAAGYSGLYLFQIDTNGKIISEKKKNGVFEASPVADQGKVYIASRNGYLYCLGSKENSISNADATVVSSSEISSKPKKKVQKKSKVAQKNVLDTSSSLSKDLKSNHFYLVSGAFGVKSNAVNEVRRLRDLGIDAFMSGAANNMNYVIVGQASSKSEINEFKLQLSEKYQLNAWVYRKP